MYPFVVLCPQYGMFSTDADDYFVEPLWNHSLAAGRGGRPHPHIVYSSSSIKNIELHTHCGVSGNNAASKLVQPTPCSSGRQPSCGYVVVDHARRVS